jgi:hypothetical protein
MRQLGARRPATRGEACSPNAQVVSSAIDLRPVPASGALLLFVIEPQSPSGAASNAQAATTRSNWDRFDQNSSDR